MTAPLCPVHKRPGRYVFGSMVTCDREDEELRAAKAPAKPQAVSFRAQFAMDRVTLNGVVLPRAPHVGDRAVMGGHCLGSVVTVSPGGQYVTVRSGQYTLMYDATGLTFEPPVQP